MKLPICTVCALFYGDFPRLMERCAAPLFKLDPSYFSLRLGANQLSEQSSSTLDRLRGEGTISPEKDIRNETNRYKYPVMRELFSGINTKWTMWFDDDSAIVSDNPSDRLLQVIEFAESRAADAVGSTYFMSLDKDQINWVRAQSWYSGKSIPRASVFLQGGWWMAKTSILQDNNWPHPDIIHRGGDVMFGVMCHQRGYKIVNYPHKKGILINADDQGRESKSPRRGSNFYPVGHKYANQPRPIREI